MKLTGRERGLVFFAMIIARDSEEAFLDAYKDVNDEAGRKTKRRTRAKLKRINTFLKKHFPQAQQQELSLGGH